MELREKEISQYLLKPSAARTSSLSRSTRLFEHIDDPDNDDIRIEKMLRKVPSTSSPDLHQLIHIVPYASSSSSSFSSSPL